MRLTKLTVTNLALVAVAASGGGLAYASVGAPKAASTTAALRTATIGQGTVMTTVSTSGNVTAPNNITVNFGTSGKLTELDVLVGDRVKEGQLLARVDSTTAQANLDSAKAQLSSAQAKLSELLQGPTSLVKQGYDLSNQQAAQQVANAQAQLANAQQQLSFDQTNLAAALTKAQEQLSNDQANESQTLAADQAAIDQAESTAAFQAQADGAQLAADEQAESVACTAPASSSPSPSPSPSPSTGPGTSACDQATAKVAQDQVKAAQDDQSVASAQAKLTADTLSYQQKVQSDRDAITSAKNSQTQGLAKDQQSVASAQQQITNAQLSQQVTANNNAQKTAAPVSSDVESDQAAVEQAQASVDNAQQTLEATSLTAPADGTIGAINEAVGQTVSAGSSSSSSSGSGSGSGSGSSSSGSSSGFITLTNLTGLQVVANIDEADASKVQVDAAAIVTLNAIPSKEFAAHVIQVADTSTVSSNVVEYQVTFALDNTASTIKPGMTANVTVTTQKADSVLNVTSSAVRSTGGTSYVMVVQPNGTQKQVDVVVGLKGDTTTEISGALKAGDEVALPASSVSRATTSTTTRTGTGATVPGGLGGGLGGGGGGVFGGGGARGGAGGRG